MPKKQTSATATATSTVPARVAKPRTPRVKTVKHKAAPVEAAAPVSMAVAVEVKPEEAASLRIVSPEERHSAIAKIAYRYWEARGYQHGSAHEDWMRAEAEYHASLN
ncbi:MAG: DUF2934 domain-containing protein [Acidobacteriota bacterium]|nr:DUF2934 domain-containing protein [Acidobacteriota bacterium]